MIKLIFFTEMTKKSLSCLQRSLKREYRNTDAISDFAHAMKQIKAPLDSDRLT